MKRLIMIMAVAGLAIFGTACSSDDNSVTDTPEKVEETKTLKLASDKLEVTIGDEIKFNVTDGKNAIADVVITEVGGGAIAKGVWKAIKAGTFKFVATKAGYEKSNEITVVVKEAEKDVANAIKVGDKAFKIESARLLAETIKEVDGNYIRLYRATLESGDVYFCRFLIDLRSGDFGVEDKEVTGAVTRIYKVVIQDIESEEVLLPGENPEADLDVNGWVLSEDGSVDFDGEAIEKFYLKMKGFDKGGNTDVIVKNEEGMVQYTGEFTSLGSVDTTNEPDSKGVRTKYKKTKAIDVSSFGENVNFANFK